jgi:Lipase (class 3)
VLLLVFSDNSCVTWDRRLKDSQTHEAFGGARASVCSCNHRSAPGCPCYTPCRTGALSSVFALALTVQNPGMPPPDPGMAERITGVLTYGQPRVGDDDYASNFDDTFGCKKAL